MFVVGTNHVAATGFETRRLVTRVFMNNGTASFTQKHEVASKLNGIFFVDVI
jgi:hypothetical protein